MSEAFIDLKNKGTEAWKVKDFTQAIEWFTKTIEIGKSEKAPELYIIYSNRSACHAQLNKFDDALKDAEECTRLNDKWARGFSRKGFALLGLNRPTDAYNAYQKALKFDSNNEEIKAGVDKAMKMVQDVPTSSSSSSAGFYNTRPTSSSSQSFVFTLLRSVAIISFLFYLQPFLSSASALGHKICLSSLMSIYVLNIHHSAGNIQFNTQYLAKVTQDPSSHFLFISVLCLTSYSSSLVLLISMLMIEGYLLFRSSQVPSVLEGKVMVYVDKIVGPANVNSSKDKKYDIIGRQVLQMSSLLQVMNGVYLILLLLTPKRNIFMLILYWQLMQMKCSMELHASVGNRPLLDAFGVADLKIMNLVGRFAPVLGIYVKIKTMMRSSIEPRDAAATQPSCVIM